MSSEDEIQGHLDLGLGHNSAKHKKWNKKRT